MRLVATALFVLLLLGAVATFRGPAPTGTQDPSRHTPRVESRQTTGLEAPTGDGSRRAATVVQSPPPVEAQADDDPPPPPPGSVHGLVVDLDWSPIAGASVEFRGAAGGVVTAHADDDGAYHCSVPAGTHQVFSVTHGATASAQASDLALDRASAFAGELDVQSGLDHEFHVHAQGERTLTGGVYCSELERIVLALDPPAAPTDENRDDAAGVRLVGELRTWFPPHHTVADLDLETSSEAYSIYLRRTAEADAARAALDGTKDREDTPPAPPPPDEVPPGLGGFRLGGLVAARYELRVFADAERRRHITLEIDLTDGDVTFAPLDVPLADFVGRVRIGADRLTLTPRPR